MFIERVLSLTLSQENGNIFHTYVLRTARSFYESLWYLRTYLRSSRLPRKSSYTKNYKTKKCPKLSKLMFQFFCLFSFLLKTNRIRSQASDARQRRTNIILFAISMIFCIRSGFFSHSLIF